MTEETKPDRQRLMVFGGTFDPVHHGHLIVARSLAESYGFEKVILMPTGAPPHKGVPGADGPARMEMLAAAVAGDSLYEVSDIEINRPGPSYTYDTIMDLRRRYGGKIDLSWLMGADMLEELPTWHRANDVLSEATILIAVRPPWDARIEKIFNNLTRQVSGEILLKLRNAVVQTPLIDISSTDIRKRISKGLSVRYLIPQAVIKIIEVRGLYSSSNP